MLRRKGRGGGVGSDKCALGGGVGWAGRGGAGRGGAKIGSRPGRSRR